MERLHRTVLFNEVIENIGQIQGRSFADLTFGEGGHTGGLLERGAKLVWGMDRDAEALKRYQAEGPYRNDDRLRLIHGRSSQLLEFIEPSSLDGIVVDLGVSTRQLLEAERGFSFSQAGPLDMRMDPSSDRSLEDLLENTDAEELANLLYRNVDLHTSRSLARRILKKWEAGELKSTLDLAQMMGEKRPGKSHPATALFLGLRMAVNEELEEVEAGIPNWVDALKPGGRLAIISFHSTEDRAVKRAFQTLAGKCICGERICTCSRAERVRLLHSKPILPSESELNENPRSRSAKLRCVEKVNIDG